MTMVLRSEQPGLRELLQGLLVDLLQPVRRIEEDEVGGDIPGFQIAQGASDILI